MSEGHAPDPASASGAASTLSSSHARSVTRYHCSGLLYQPGDVIQPGSWGKVIEGAGLAHNLAWRELAFEIARLDQSPESASRLRSVFLLATEQEAVRYIRSKGGINHLYLVSVLDDTATTHRGDMAAFEAFAQNSGFASWRAIIDKYWRGEQVGDEPQWELLTHSPVKIQSYLGRR